MPSILCVGGDIQLLETRAVVLRQTGAEVRCAPSSKALAALESQPFDLVVLCHSVKSDEARQIYETAHRRLPSAQVLRLTRVDALAPETVCADKVVSTNPASVVQCATELLHRQGNGKNPECPALEAVPGIGALPGREIPEQPFVR